MVGPMVDPAKAEYDFCLKASRVSADSKQQGELR